MSFLISSLQLLLPRIYSQHLQICHSSIHIFHWLLIMSRWKFKVLSVSCKCIYISWRSVSSLASFFATLPLAHGSYALGSLIFFEHRHFLITRSLFPLPGMLFPWIFLTLLIPTLRPCLCSNLTTSEMLPLPPNLKEPCCGSLVRIMFSL